MAKDDYDVLVFKILTYLYRKLKDNYIDDMYLCPLTDDFPVRDDYFISIFEDLEDKGYIKNLILTKAWGGDVVGYDLSKIKITGDGIAYLRDNSRMKKLINLIKEARAIMSLWN
ncbi:MAG: YjcQ family protein [Tissierellia bacterium]|nr:YjcQ family protein [Tissierellia bacterium]